MALTIGAAQLEPSRGDVSENTERHLRLVRLAAAHGVEALAFPELSLTGYELDLAERLAFSEDDARLEPLRRAASDHRMVLVVGAPVRLSSGLHIGAFIVYPDGSVALYAKHHLGGEEGRVFQPSDRDPLVHLTDATAAVAICADTSHASHPASAAARGANVYLAGVLFSPSEFARVTPKLKRYAVRYSMTVVLANSGGHSSTLESAGGSSIWSGSGELVARFEGLGAGIALATRTESGWAGSAVADVADRDD